MSKFCLAVFIWIKKFLVLLNVIVKSFIRKLIKSLFLYFDALKWKTVRDSLFWVGSLHKEFENERLRMEDCLLDFASVRCASHVTMCFICDQELQWQPHWTVYSYRNYECDLFIHYNYYSFIYEPHYESKISIR